MVFPYWSTLIDCCMLPYLIVCIQASGIFDSAIRVDVVGMKSYMDNLLTVTPS